MGLRRIAPACTRKAVTDLRRVGMRKDHIPIDVDGNDVPFPPHAQPACYDAALFNSASVSPTNGTNTSAAV